MTAAVIPVDVVEVPVASLDALIAMKSNSEPAKDKTHLLELLALKKISEESR